MNSQTKENYLKSIYFLSKKNKEISLTELSDLMNVSKPTANNMINADNTNIIKKHNDSDGKNNGR